MTLIAIIDNAIAISYDINCVINLGICSVANLYANHKKNIKSLQIVIF